MSTAPTRLPRAARREHLLDVAAGLILDGGVDAVNMEAVAARAGVSKGLGYAYFDNSSDLLVALYDREMSDLEQRTLAGMREASDFEGKIRAAVSAWFDLVAERGALLGALFGSAIVRDAVEVRGRSGQREMQNFYGRMIERFGAHKGDRATLEETYMRLAMGGLRALAARA
jgi:AcrR family transcriptional regulator